MTKLFNKVDENVNIKSFGKRKINEEEVNIEIVGNVHNVYVNDDGSVFKIY